jgi:hypothetical protein
MLQVLGVAVKLTDQFTGLRGDTCLFRFDVGKRT